MNLEGNGGSVEEQENDHVQVDTGELAQFRSRWKEELEVLSDVTDRATTTSTTDTVSTSATKTATTITSPTNTEAEYSNYSAPRDGCEEQSPLDGDDGGEDVKKEAARFYWMGVAAEESGDMNDAILYYRRAVQLDPDVDLKSADQTPPQAPPNDEDDEIIKAENCESVLLESLTNEIQRLSVNAFCQPRKPTQETHISTLPVEVLRLLLRWVSSSQLDMRAIEQVSMVCKGFYILAREPQLWRSACRKLWGSECEPGGYGNWRKMFILKPHLHFNGVYISKTSYIRQGNHSVDGFYKPYHTVTFYRYLRFFANGFVMYLTTPDEPLLVVNKMCHKHSSETILLGKYQVQDKTILIDLLSAHPQQASSHHNARRGRGKSKSKQLQEVTHERRFHMELLLNKKRTRQLACIEHYCSTLHIPSGQEQTTQFSINHMYTPFNFSRVKRYSLNSTGFLS